MADGRIRRQPYGEHRGCHLVTGTCQSGGSPSAGRVEACLHGLAPQAPTWRAWETLRASDALTGMSIWWHNHLDPTSPRSPPTHENSRPLGRLDA
ncbi:DUF4913 domain-containing protein [Micromonospora sp. NPDC007220]|uniref:DUF4913 domain-containing protein n=1 Tax=Micromonospora sp. NPDC007220 TaxID=3154318 RepID=UPI0033E92543